MLLLWMFLALALGVLVGLKWPRKPKVVVQWKERVVEVPIKLPDNLEPAQGPDAAEKEMGWEKNDKFSVCPTCGSRLKVKK